MERARGGGLWHMVFAAFFFAVMSLLVRVAGQRLPSSQIVLARAAVALVISLAMVRRAGLSPWGKHRGLLVTRGLLGFAGLTCYFWSLTHLPLAEAAVIQYTNPVFTALLAALVLRERMRRVEWVGVLVSLCGVLLVARPAVVFGAQASSLPPWPVAVALLGALASAGAYVAVRKSVGAEDPLVVVLWFTLVATPLAAPVAIAQWVPPVGWEWAVLVGVGVTTQIAQIFMTHGLHREPAGRATAVSYLQIVFVMLLGLLFLGEVPDLMTVGGALLIGAGVMAVALWPKREPLAPRLE